MACRIPRSKGKSVGLVQSETTVTVEKMREEDMATINIHTSGEILCERKAVWSYLKTQGVIYEFWGTERLTGHLKESYTLSPEEQQAILDLYGPEISNLKSRQGYLTQDIVVLSGATQNLDAILGKFRREHHHIDDEVRFVVDGGGIFTIRKGNLIFDITVTAGDLLVVPAYTRHWFDLTSEQRIKCIRIFKDPAGWVAIYDEPAIPSEAVSP
jgi:1,2-dihydroxy-3-keto-5-methylthiopentene dioxygenase